MRIVFFVHRYWPCVGGVEKYIHELSKALLRMGHEVQVVAGATDSEQAEVDLHEGVKIYRFPAHRSPLRTRWWFLRYVRLFLRADVIHVSNTHMLELYWQTVGWLINPRKVFLTRHGMSYVYPVPEWERRRARRSLKLASGIVHDGCFIERWLGVKPDICPNQGLSPEADKISHIPEPPPDSAIFIGRLEPDSGIGNYIDAVSCLVHRHKLPFRLEVFGNGSLLSKLRTRCEQEHLPVHFHGRVAYAQNHIQQSCFAFIDGRMAMQEAMAGKRLVVASYNDPLKCDYINGEPFSPFLVSGSCGEQITKHVLHFIHHPQERQTLVERAFAHARTLSWRRTALAYQTLWEERLASCKARWSTVWQMMHTIQLVQESRRPKERWALAYEPYTTLPLPAESTLAE